MESTNRLDGRHVLVVDDSKEMTSLLADVLTDAGARVTEANGGEAAMSFMAAADPDVIFLDLAMPEPDGWKVLRFMRTFLPHLLPRTIVLTAEAYPGQESPRLKNMRMACMPKPFLLADLVAHARQAIDETSRCRAAV
jgi:CheY-like chemotaxis protein